MSEKSNLEKLEEIRKDQAYYDMIADASEIWQPCCDCDGHDACRDFGCAIKRGIIEIPNY